MQDSSANFLIVYLGINGKGKSATNTQKKAKSVQRYDKIIYYNYRAEVTSSQVMHPNHLKPARLLFIVYLHSFHFTMYPLTKLFKTK